MAISDKRRKIETLVLKTISTLDRSGTNTERMKEFFSSMDDSMFKEWIELIRNKKVQIFIYAPNMKIFLKIEDALKAADDLNLQLFERIRLWDSVTRRYFLTPFPYLVLSLPVRRLKQYLMDKISVPESDKVTNPMTGQVAKPDKGSGISLVEAQTLDSKGLHKTLIELTNIRGGNLGAYADFKRSLEENGEVHMSEIDMSGGVRSATIARVLLNSMHIENNL